MIWDIEYDLWTINVIYPWEEVIGFECRELLLLSIVFMKF